MFQAVYGLGAPLQDGMKWLLDALKNDVLADALAGAPPLARSFVVDGLVDGVGTVLTFLPLMAVFFGAMAVVEDSGYLSRAAWLMDALMGRLGLDGRAFVMQLMGFGCNVPALLGTRVMRNRAARLLSMLVIPFSLCSARLQVFLFITAAVLQPGGGAGRAVRALCRELRGGVPDRGRSGSTATRAASRMLMELPPYRLPTPRMVVTEAWRATSHFLRRATGFIVAGVLLIWVLTRLPRRRRAGGAGDDRRAARRRGSRRSSSRSASIR